MTQVVTGSEVPPSAEPSSAAPTEAPPTEAPRVAPSAQTPTGDERYTQVPSDQLAPWGGRFGEAISRAARYDKLADRGDLDLIHHLEQSGVPPKDLKDALTALAGDVPLSEVLKALAEPPEDTGSPPANTNVAPFDPDAFLQQVAEQVRSALAEERQATTEQETKKQEQERLTQAEKAVKEHWDKVFTDAKVPGDGARHRAAKALAQEATVRAIAENLQADHPALTPDAAMAEAQKYLPTDQDLDRATALFQDDLKDLGTEFVSAAAEGQLGMPSGTLGGGAGGPAPTPEHAGEMSPQDQAALVEKAVDRVLASKD